MIEKEIMLHTKQLLVNRDDKIIVDLCSQNKGRPEQYSEFWNYIKQLIIDDIKQLYTYHMLY